MKTIHNKNIFVHLCIWILFFLMFSWVFWSEGHQDYPKKAGILTMSSLLIFYSNFFLVKFFFFRGKRLIYILGLIIIILLGPILFLQLYVQDNLQWSFLSSDYLAFIGVVFFFLCLSWLVITGENWFQKTLARENFEKQMITTELHYLKSQINPHFFFNTLNNIYTLSYTHSPKTTEAIMKLSSIMRYMLYESNTAFVPFAREIQYLQDYISLQQLRYKENSIVEMKISGHTDNLKVAPLLFIHLLENAYKHSNCKLQSNDIKVKITFIDGVLNFTVVNPVNASIENENSDTRIGGIGLQNLRKRLELIYPERHKLIFSKSTTRFEAQLIINCLNK